MTRKKYIFNEETLSYEEVKVSFKEHLKGVAFVMLAGVPMLFLCSFLYTDVLGLKSPKTWFMEKQNKELLASHAIMNQRLDKISQTLFDVQMRDNTVYRPVFGMDEIPAEVRNAGFGGVDRYEALVSLKDGQMLISSAMKLDILTKKAYIQSRSLDEVNILAKKSGEMASCVPNINPVNMHAPKVRITSSYGYRIHPILHCKSYHSGIDIAGQIGESVMVTGDGVVEMAATKYFGYGNCIVVNHGFGYKTRYAHLDRIDVKEGQKVSRGQVIASMGNTGRSTGPHLHYEVIYMGRSVNPWYYLSEEL